MPGFDALVANTTLPNRLFLEASAGTGKTFAIEHSLIRFLVDKNGPQIDEILIVTFTKAAAYDLRKRISSTLATMLKNLGHPEKLPPYVLSEIQKENSAFSRVEKKLKRSFAHLDEAAIFTIHSFCFHLLQEHMSHALDAKKESAGTNVLECLLKDFLRTEVNESLVSPAQLEALLRYHRYDIDAFVAHLLKWVEKRLPIATPPPVLSAHQQCIKTLKERYGLTYEKILEDLHQHATCFKGFCNRDKQLKPEVIASLTAVAALFVGEGSGDFIPILADFHPDNRLKRGISAPLHYPGLMEEIQETLIPIVAVGMDPLSIEAQIAEGARKWVEAKLASEEILFFDDLIQKVEDKCQDLAFVQEVRNRYRLVMIDEFQDTDPRQWKIFSTLFLSPDFNGNLFVVGDPKQSIYRFRSADLYTYLEAKKSFPKEAHFSLQTNFRSSCDLIESINSLLTPLERCFVLPRLNEAFPCPPVHAGKEETTSWKDGKKSLHFCVGKQESAFYPFVAIEIEKLHRLHQIPYSECAILVKDRYQAERIHAFLQSQKIPSMLARTQFLHKTPAHAVLQELLQAITDPQDFNAVKKVLFGPLFLWNLDALSQTDLSLFYHLNEILTSQGILACFMHLMEKDDVREKLFRYPNGCELYCDLLQLVEILASKGLPIDEMLPFLKSMTYAGDEAEDLKSRQSLAKEAVPILTIHASKGLEFSVVFPLGLLLPTPTRKELFPDDQKRCLTLDPSKFALHAKECDAEKMRQFYVAVTRAKKRLYLPLIQEKEKSASSGQGSPMALFLEQALAGRAMEEWISSIETASYSHVDTSCTPIDPTPLPLPSLHPPVPYTFSFTPCLLDSYTSLAIAALYDEEKKTDPDLPLGAETGRLLHLLFEKLSFAKAFSYASPSDFLSFATEALRGTVLEAHALIASQILFNALHAPLSDEENTFSLAEVDPAKILKEMAFLYPKAGGSGWIKGFVDLFFEHKGKWYCIDWKSNALEAYTQEKMHEEMLRHDYFLQERIYREALMRYTSLLNPSISWGGSYYLFLRGQPPGVYRIWQN